MGEGFACEIAAVQFTAEFGDQKLVKNYMAKFISEGPTASLVREVIMKEFVSGFYLKNINTHTHTHMYGYVFFFFFFFF